MWGINHNFLSHFFIAVHLSHFQLWAVIYDTVINLGVHRLFLFPFKHYISALRYLDLELLERKTLMHLRLLMKFAKLLSKRLYQFKLLPAM